MEAKEYLSQYCELTRRANLLREEIQAELKIIDEIKAGLHGIDEIKMQPVITKLTVKALQLQDKIPEYVRTCEEILATIERIPGNKGEILYKRYIDNDKWEDIASSMHYSTRRVMGIHKEALEEVNKLIN